MESPSGLASQGRQARQIALGCCLPVLVPAGAAAAGGCARQTRRAAVPVSAFSGFVWLLATLELRRGVALTVVVVVVMVMDAGR